MSTADLIRYAVAPVFTKEVGIGVAIVLVLLLIKLRMRPRYYYFVRHGETMMNAAHIKQGAEGGLSDAGKTQAERVGTALAGLGISRIVSSPYERAKETAQIIATHVRAPIRYSPLLVERKNPSEIIGRKRDEPQVLAIVDQIDLQYHADDYRYSDEENFEDLKARAEKALRYLARESGRTTCVVTHHAFLKMLLATMQYRDQLHAGDYIKLSFLNTSDNGGISIAEYSPWQRFSATGGWEVVSYNEAVQ